LSAIYRDLIAVFFSPSGLANCYGVIPFAFPAAVELEGLKAISDALVCRRRHDKYAVVSAKKLLLKGSNKQCNQYIANWRKRAVNKVCKAFELVKQAKMKAFKNKLYFYRKACSLSPVLSDKDPNPGEMEVAAAHGFEEPEKEGLIEAVEKDIKME
jgi:hypothetical protein